MPLSGSLIIFWNGTDADIPVGWTRKAELDGYYLKGIETSGCNPGKTGGGTHTHTSGSHNHTQGAHTHSISVASDGGRGIRAQAGGELSAAHTHSVTIGNTTATNVANAELTSASVTSEPSFHTLIAINSSVANGIPISGIAYYTSESTPDGFKVCDGNNSTPNLTSKFIKIPSAGHNAGETGGGSHTHSTTSHTHSQSQHRHTINTSSKTTGIVDLGSDGDTGAAKTHGHSLVNSSYTTAVNSSATVSMSSDTLEPPFNTLIAMQNQSGEESLPFGVICGFIGLLEDIPTGWVLCDGNNGTPDLTDKFIKTTTVTSGVGTTGGLIVHTHTANTHTHGVTSHKHTGDTGDPDDTDKALYMYGYIYQVSDTSHTHGITWSNTAPSNSSTVVPINNSTTDTRPPFYEVAYIQYQTQAFRQNAQVIIIM